jgi:hypothetical protein
MITTSIVMTLAASLLAAPVSAGQHSPQHTHAQDRAQHGMGFDQERTTHHFLVERSGGTIQVTANDPADSASVAQVRAHLKHITSAFSQGDFSIPMFVHDTDPPGRAIMQARRAHLTLTYEDLGGGGKVVIRTADDKARSALHDFLRFQIREHRTGDPLNPK